MKLFLATLSTLLLVVLCESKSVKKKDDFDDDFFSKDNMGLDDDFSLGLGLDDFDKDIQKDITDMTQKTRASVANALGVDEKTLDKPNYKKSISKKGKEGIWHTKTHAAVENQAKHTKNFAFQSKAMSFSKVGVAHSSKKDSSKKESSKKKSSKKESSKKESSKKESPKKESSKKE